MLDPDLDEPGRPLIARLKHDDGTFSPFLIEQTKYDNCVDLAQVGFENVTRPMVEAAGLTWREWCRFLDLVYDHQEFTEAWMAAVEANYEATTGKRLERPEMVRDRLGFLHLKDPPEQAPPSGESEMPPLFGREPPPDTDWGERG